MSCRIHVIFEDHTLDQYVARPIVKAMAADAGRPRARVKAVSTPPPRGIEAVVQRFDELSARYAAAGDLVVFALDADGLDGAAGRPDRKAVLEARRQALPEDVARKVLVVLARQELEVWAMWGARERLGAAWADVRAERHPKDVHWPRLLEPGDATLPGKGRQRLVEESLALGWASVCGGCPELAEATEEMRARLTAGD